MIGQQKEKEESQKAETHQAFRWWFKEEEEHDNSQKSLQHFSEWVSSKKEESLQQVDSATVIRTPPSPNSANQTQTQHKHDGQFN